jgi:hypothetical protein
MAARPDTDNRRRTRRNLLKAALVGGAALAAGPALAIRPAAGALPCDNPDLQVCPYNDYYLELDQGQITIGGILVTYASAPLAARGTLTWSTTNTRTDTFRMITERNEQVSASITIGPWNSGPQTLPRFSVSGGVTRAQGISSKVTDAITTSSTETQSIQTAPTNGGYNTWENTAFYIMARPVLAISVQTFNEWYQDRPGGPPLIRTTYLPGTYFRFVNGGAYFPRSARELRDDPGTRAFIGPETADAILAQYPLRADQTSATQLGLAGPRFGSPAAIAPGEVPFTFARSMTGTHTHIAENSRSITTEIKSGFKVDIPGLGTLFGFETSNKITTTHTSVQEMTNTQVISTQGTLSSDLNHLNYIIEDQTWNTVLITDEGPLSGQVSTVSGVVTAVDGAPIDGAVVSMPVGGVTYQAYADEQGRYEFRVDNRVPPGRYQVTCAEVSRSVTVGKGTAATANYRAVDAGLARERPR